jgi:putative chitinase
MTIDRTKFFTEVRESIFNGRLAQRQVDGMNFIISVWEKSSFTDTRWLSYMLGTAYHETAGTMQPIHEFGSDAYFTRMYDVEGRRPEVARKMGNTKPGDGIKYRGMGYVQLTWKNNYARAGTLLGVDLVGNPNLAMQPEIAARIMFEGMTDEKIIFEDKSGGPGIPNGPGEGTDFSFTGKVLEDYFNDTTEDWEGARRIINGTDHAAMIAETAQNFNDAIAEATT